MANPGNPIWVREDLHRRLRMLSGVIGVTMRGLCEQALEAFLPAMEEAAAEEERERREAERNRPIVEARLKQENEQAYHEHMRELQRQTGFDKYIGWKPPKREA